jgi:hypothetical protein
MKAQDVLRNGYDAFISYNHADRDWARELAERIARVDFHGRPLRAWLDEQWRFARARLSQPCLPGSCPDVSATLTTVVFGHSSLRWLEISS